jgi:hypothetical protein
MGRLVLILIVTSSQVTVSPSSPVTQSGNSYFRVRHEWGLLVDAMDTRPLRIQDQRDGLLLWYKTFKLDHLKRHDLLI